MNTALAWLTAFMMCGMVIMEVFFGAVLAIGIGAILFTVSVIGFIVNWQYRPEKPGK